MQAVESCCAQAVENRFIYKTRLPKAIQNGNCKKVSRLFSTQKDELVLFQRVEARKLCRAIFNGTDTSLFSMPCSTCSNNKVEQVDRRLCPQGSAHTGHFWHIQIIYGANTGHFSHIRSIYTGHIHGTFLAYTEHIRGIFGIYGAYTGHIRGIFGTYTEHIRGIYGTFLAYTEHIRSIYGAFLAYTEHIRGIYGTFLAYTEHMRGIYGAYTECCPCQQAFSQKRPPWHHGLTEKLEKRYYTTPLQRLQPLPFSGYNRSSKNSFSGLYNTASAKIMLRL